MWGVRTRLKTGAQLSLEAKKVLMNTMFARIRLALAASALVLGAAVIFLPTVRAGTVTVDDSTGVVNQAFS